jgi:hypothetical protein
MNFKNRITKQFIRGSLRMTVLLFLFCSPILLMAKQNGSISSPKMMETLTDTSKLSIQDTLALVASHAPAMVRYTSGQEFFTNKYSYSESCYLANLKWIADYPSEAASFDALVTDFLAKTDVNSLSATQAGIYYDLDAQLIMVRHTR